MITEVLQHFDVDTESVRIEPFGNGLINRTWLIEEHDKKFILQRINENVFQKPEAIDHNIKAINWFLKTHSPGYKFTAPVVSKNKESLIKTRNGSFRMFEFILQSHTYQVLQNPCLAYEASKQFGRFTNVLSGFDINQLKITIPDFHNLLLRYEQYNLALYKSGSARIAESGETIKSLHEHYHIVETYKTLIQNSSFKNRVTHHDTKISNVLFDENNKGICVIDLDTVMPGHFISDVGDMMRTYLSPSGEEETDFNKIAVRDEYFDAIVQGYLSEMQNELSDTEKYYFVYAGQFMIYMQTLRFITDYLNNDIYYGAGYELHNLNRANNQLTLLNILTKKEKELNERVVYFINTNRNN